MKKEIVIVVSQDGADFYCECGCGAIIWSAPFNVPGFSKSRAAQARYEFLEWLGKEREVDAVDFQ